LTTGIETVTADPDCDHLSAIPASDNALQILGKLKTCVGKVLTEAKSVETSNQASMDANAKYKEGFDHVFKTLKELKESDLERVFQQQHANVWHKLQEHAKTIKTTLEGMFDAGSTDVARNQN